MGGFGHTGGRHAIRLLVVVVGVAVALLVSTVPAQAQITISKSGAYGYLSRYIDALHVQCRGEDWGPSISPRYVRSVSAPGAYITRSTSSTYANVQQTLYTRHTAQYSNGAGWVDYQTTGWMQDTRGPNQEFFSRGGQFPIYGSNWSWRVVSEYVWSAGSVWLGSATNLYSVAEYGAVTDIENQPWLGVHLRITTGTSQGSGYCTIN